MGMVMRPWLSKVGIMDTSRSPSMRQDSMCTERRSMRSVRTPKGPINLHDGLGQHDLAGPWPPKRSWPLRTLLWIPL